MIAYETLRHVPRATSYLLFGCAGTQLFIAATGACGFRWLNRECVCIAVLVLALALAALAYVAGATYLWIRDTQAAQPENLLLVFAIASVADAFLLITLVFTLALYRQSRAAFRQKETSHQMQEEYSDYESRERPGRRGRKARSRPREYLPDEQL